MNKIKVLCMALFLVALSVNSSAHSTKGRIKVPWQVCLGDDHPKNRSHRQGGCLTVRIKGRKVKA